MLYLVSYDVSTETQSGRRRLRQVARVCENYGIRVQSSVFECVMNEETFLTFRKKLIDIIDAQKDSLRFYRLGKHGREKVIHIGLDRTLDVEAPLII